MTTQTQPSRTGALPSQPPLTRGRRVAIIGSLAFAAFVMILNDTELTVLLPALMHEFNITAATGGWLTTAFMLTMAVVIPTTGYLLSRFSARNIFLVAIGFFLVGSLLAALAPNFAVMLLARVVQACGTAIIMPRIMTTSLRLGLAHDLLVHDPARRDLRPHRRRCARAHRAGPARAARCREHPALNRRVWRLRLRHQQSRSHRDGRPRGGHRARRRHCRPLPVHSPPAAPRQRRGLLACTIPGVLLLAVGQWLLVATVESAPVVWTAVAFTIFGTGMSFTMAAMMTHSLSTLPGELYSHGSAIINTVQQLAGAVGTSIFLALFALGSSASVVVGGVLTTLALGIMGFIRRPAAV